MSRWRDYARRRIAELVKDLPADATYKEHRKALWGKGYPAHQGTKWGRKMWGKEVRNHLARLNDPTYQITADNFKWPDDIAFPWKGESNA